MAAAREFAHEAAEGLRAPSSTRFRDALYLLLANKVGLMGGLLTLFVLCVAGVGWVVLATRLAAPPLPRPEPVRQPARARRQRPPARHRPVRARHPLAHHRRHGHLDADRHRRDERHPRPRHGHGRHRGLRRRQGRHGHHRPDRPHLGLPAAARRGDLRGHPGAGPGGRDPRRRVGRLGRLRARRAGPGESCASASSSRRRARSARRPGGSCSATCSRTCSARCW